MKQEIAEVLTGLGLNEKDQRVYLALLQIGQTTVTPLARAERLPATTVQSVLERLVDRGMVRVAKRKSRSVFEAEDPIVFRRLIERQVNEVTAVIPFLEKMKAEPSVSPKIRVYYRERATDIFREALKSKNKTVHEIVSAGPLQHVLGEKFHFTRRRVKLSVRLKSLRVEAHEIKKYNKTIDQKELRESKFLPRELTFKGNILFWDNTVAFFTTKDEGLSWTVESKTLRETFEQLFDLLWSVSRQIDASTKAP